MKTATGPPVKNEASAIIFVASAVNAAIFSRALSAKSFLYQTEVDHAHGNSLAFLPYVNRF